MFNSQILKNDRIIYAVITILSIALIGLIGLQFYWVNLAKSVNEERFAQKVNDALTEVVKKLEKYEALSLVSQRYPVEYDTTSFSAFRVDSSGVGHFEQQLVIKETKRIASEEMAKEGQFVEIEEETRIDRKGTARHGATPRLMTESKVPKPQFKLWGQPLDTGLIQSHLDPIQTLKALQKQDIVYEAFSDVMGRILVNEPQNIVDRVDKKLLDSLLRLELGYQGINQNCEFGIENTSPRGSVSHSHVSDTTLKASIFGSEFHVSLFPSDLYRNNDSKLFVQFPNQNTYTSAKLRLIMIASVVFITLIVLSFAFAMITIFRQKKLSEITKDFISNLTHELKTPISTVALATEALMDPDIRSLTGQTDRYLRVIKEENNRLGMQVEKVLQIARLDRGNVKLKMGQVDINRLITKSAKHIRLPIETRSGTLELALDESRPIVVEGDEHHLANVINNLVENANKYSPESPRLKVTTVGMERGIKIMVSDQGQGIPKEMQNKIFDKFFRVPTGNRHDVKGFGLGLSYVKNMVDAHKGHISVRSELGKGSTFTIFLPYTQNMP